MDTYTVFEAIVIHVKVRGVRGAADFRDVGGFAVADVVPVDTREKRVLFKVLDSVLAQPVFSAADEPSDEIFSIFGHIGHLKWKLEALLGMKKDYKYTNYTSLNNTENNTSHKNNSTWGWKDEGEFHF